MYHEINAPELFRERQRALLEEAGNERLARRLRAGRTSKARSTTGVVAVALSFLAALALAVGLLTLFDARPAQAAFPGANGKIAFASNRVTATNTTGDQEIFTMDLNGMNPTQLTENTATDYLPAWSADGQQIAFSSNRDGNIHNVFTMDDDGSTETNRTNEPNTYDSQPDWSPTAAKLTFVSSRVTPTNPTGDYEIFTMDVGGTNLAQLTNNTTGDFSPAWSPNGKKIAFQSERDGDSEIFTMNANGSNQKKLTKNTAYDSEPDWSPSGTKIAFQSNRLKATNPTGDFELYTMRATGDKQRQRTNNTASDVYPAWSPDGAEIVFETNRDANAEIYTMKADGSDQINLTNNSAEDRFPDWQPLP